MKLPKFTPPKLSENAKLRVTRVYGLFSAVVYKLVPIVILGLIFAQIAVVIDQNHYRNAPADEFLKYNEFTVQNARENEDVNFRVCRDRISNIVYKSDLGIYIIANADADNEQRVKVYSRNIGGTITNQCENKIIRATDFKHNVGTYEMGFCVRFNVKYGYEKEICRTSNRYRIYAQPTDLESKIKSLEKQLENAKRQRDEAAGDINQPTDQSLAAPQQRQTANNGTNTQTPGQSSTGGQSNGNSGGSGGGNSSGGNETPPAPSCTLGIGNGGLLCGSDGLLRL